MSVAKVRCPTLLPADIHFLAGGVCTSYPQLRARPCHDLYRREQDTGDSHGNEVLSSHEMETREMVRLMALVMTLLSGVAAASPPVSWVGRTMFPSYTIWRSWHLKILEGSCICIRSTHDILSLSSNTGDPHICMASLLKENNPTATPLSRAKKKTQKKHKKNKRSSDRSGT